MIAINIWENNIITMETEEDKELMMMRLETLKSKLNIFIITHFFKFSFD